MLSWEQTPSIASMRCERAWVEIDLSALSENIHRLKQFLSPQTDLMAVVKADAYGHGAVTVAQTALMAGASWLGVATIPEGIELREAGMTAPILILGATYTAEQIQAMARWHLQPTLCSPKQAMVFSEVLKKSRHQRSVPVHLKLDTGMSRLGVPWKEAAAFVQLVSRLGNLEIASIYSHFATADSLDQTVMRQQHRHFQEALSQIQQAGIALPRLHLSNSAATLTDKNLHYDMVRLGLVMYGLYPAPHLKPVTPLKPVCSVKARVTQVKTIEAGTGVSYGYQFVATQEMRLAVVGIGYADGVPRNLSNKMQVIVQGQLVPQVGAITMDQIMLDVTNIPHIEAGEVVTLLGRDGNCEITPDDWASMLGTISWEILCGFKHRLPRVPVRQSLESLKSQEK